MRRLWKLFEVEHEKAAGILMENREKLDDKARYLYEKETITEKNS